LKVAADHATVKRRIDDYLWRDSSMPVSRLRRILESHFLHFDEVGIVGGLARDFSRLGRRGFRSDVDLVINAPASSVARLAEQLNAQENRFGGFAFCHPHWKVDFWALETTWAARAGHVSVCRIEDVIQSTFFDSDSIVYDLKRRRIITSQGYFQRMAEGVLDIQLEPNPSVQGNLLRAIRRMFIWQFTPGKKLESFICRELDEDVFCKIREVEKNIYPTNILSDFHSPEEVKDYLFDPSQRRRFDPDFGAQLRLPGI